MDNPEGLEYRKVKMSPELMDEWATRNEDGYRLVWSWGEPDADGFYCPTVAIDYNDRLGGQGDLHIPDQTHQDDG